MPSQMAYGDEELTPEQAEALAQELEATRQRIAETPVSQIITTHALGLYELSVIHLRKSPPDFDSAQVAIDGLHGMLESLEGRMGEQEEALNQALNDIQMAFVELKSQAGQANGGSAEEPDASESPDI